MKGDHAPDGVCVVAEPIAAGLARENRHDRGLAMTNRRDFLQGAIWAALPVVAAAPRPAGARAALAPACQAALIDERHAESRAFGAAFAERGVSVHALPDGDVTALWRESIGPTWRRAPVPVAGLTQAAVLFCLEQLGWSLGLRVVFHAQHVVSAARPARHKVLRSTAAGGAVDARGLGMRGPQWPSYLASMVASHGAPARQRHVPPTGMELAPPLPAGAQLLTSWIIA
jgi:hypothetical protein